jgi:GntR family transcriptional regulator, rspAB operon transcriptional repressor
MTTRANDTTGAKNGTVPHGLSVSSIHGQLRDAILRGEIAPGEVTTQVHLAELLGVGRNPLREALRILEREGLVVSAPNHRVRVAGLSADDAEDIYVVRIPLEVTAIRLTVPRLKSADIADLEGLLAQIKHYLSQSDLRGIRIPHRAFHQRLVDGAGERGRAIIGELFDHAERYRMFYTGGTEESWAARTPEHRAILDAAAAGDADAAAYHLAAHYLQTAARVFAAIDPTHDLDRLWSAVHGCIPDSSRLVDDLAVARSLPTA